MRVGQRRPASLLQHVNHQRHGSVDRQSVGNLDGGLVAGVLHVDIDALIGQKLDDLADRFLRNQAAGACDRSVDRIGGVYDRFGAKICFTTSRQV